MDVYVKGARRNVWMLMFKLREGGTTKKYAMNVSMFMFMLRERGGTTKKDVMNVWMFMFVKGGMQQQKVVLSVPSRCFWATELMSHASKGTCL